MVCGRGRGGGGSLTPSFSLLGVPCTYSEKHIIIKRRTRPVSFSFPAVLYAMSARRPGFSKRYMHPQFSTISATRRGMMTKPTPVSLVWPIYCSLPFIVMEVVVLPV